MPFLIWGVPVVKAIWRFDQLISVEHALPSGSHKSRSNASNGRSQTGPYVSVGIGPDWVGDSNLTINGNRLTSHWDAGFGGFVGVGDAFPIGLRLELEGSGRQDGVTSFNNHPWYGTQWDTSVLANLLYDFSTGTRFVPYIGGGLGITRLSWGNNFRGLGPYIYDDSNTQLGWQGIVGTAYTLTPRLALTADFRIKGANGNRFRSSGPPGSDVTGYDYNTKSLFFGLRYTL